MKKLKCLFHFFLLFLLLMLCARPMEVQSAGKPPFNGTKPLDFISCTLLNGAKAGSRTKIPLTPKLSLQFDKNVVDALVWDNNKASISILTANGEKLQTDVTKIDDTVDFSYRQRIFIKPVQPLKPGASYKIVVSPKLTAKNGILLSQSTNGKEIIIPFAAQAVINSNIIAAVSASGKSASGFHWNLSILDIGLITLISVWVALEINIYKRHRKKREMQQDTESDKQL